jgi:adenosine deaminase
MLRELQFRVTVNTDNRLLGGTTLTREFLLLAETFGYGLADVAWFTVNAMKSAFLPFDERLLLINDVLKPGFAALKAEAAMDRVRPLG